MERYEAYKDSGVEWIGEIPSTWTLARTKAVFSNKKRVVGDKANEYQRLALTMHGVLLRDKDDNEGLQPEQFEGYQILEANELVFKLIDLENIKTSRVGLSPYTGIVSPAYITLTQTDSDNRYFYYWFFALYQQNVFNQLGGNGVRSALNKDDLLNLPMLLPKQDEQRAIANYLDARTAEIDALVADCEREVGLLREYRKAVISEAVTKGLDPDAPMKDSGVEWIGEIPEGWVIVPFKAIGTVAANLQHPADYPDLPQVSPDRIEKDSGRLLPCFSVAEVGVESDNHVFHAGDILYSKVRPALNKVTVAPFDGMCSADMYPIESSQNKRWLVFYMLSNAFMEQVIVSTDRVKMPKINKEELGAFKVVLPSVDEQCEIAVYLDAKNAEIDSLIEAKQQMADKLREYRRSLISEAVTGKFKVPGV